MTQLEQSGAVNNEAVGEPQKQPVQLTLHRPDSPLFFFFLVLFSFGSYSCFWLYSRAKDIKKIQQNTMSPWLWFFVPLILIAQIFAWPGFIKELKKAQQVRQVPVWQAWSGGWVILILLSNVLINISDRVLGDELWAVVGLAAWAGLLTVLHIQLSTLKAVGQGILLKPRHLAIQLGKWLVFIFGAVLFLFTLYEFGLKKVLNSELKSYQSGEEFRSKTLGLRFPFLQDGWQQVSIGSYSDGTSDMEFAGPLSGSSIIVFKHDASSSFESIANFRMDNFADEYAPNKCIQQRRLIDESLKVRMLLSCETRHFGLPLGVFVAVVKSGNQYIELYSEITGNQYPYQRQKQVLQKMLAEVQSYE